MKCHYEVLEVSRDVNNDDLKKAYRKAALKWHPDKNIDNADHAKEQFQLVQQAYETLSDSHERAWYDAHRDAILKGGLGSDYKDESLDVFPYFSTSCFKGYGDDDKGFYSIYREVFNKIAAEDADYMEDGDSDFEIPGFGTSTSSFKDIVQTFYAHWQDYATKKSFSWLDQYDIKDLPNRRVAKLVEKENKKIRDKARKERNEQIRNLVAFVRKRDKRVQAQAELVKEQIAEKARIAEERRKSKIRERRQQMNDHQESEWSKFSNFEAELKNIEKALKVEHGDSDPYTDEDEMDAKENGDADDLEDFDVLYCPACQKLFKTVKAFANHEGSKKHKENVKKLKQSMQEEEELYEETEEEDLEEEELEEEQSDEDEECDKSDKKLNEDKSTGEIDDSDKREKSDSVLDVESEDSDSEVISKSKKKKETQNSEVNDIASSEEEDEMNDFSMLSKKQRRRLQQQKVVDKVVDSPKDVDSEIETEPKTAVEPDANVSSNVGDEVNKTKLKGKKAKDARKQKRQAEVPASTNGSLASKNGGVGKSSKKVTNTKVLDPSVIDTEHICVTCSSNFNSKNKLFDHLKKTGHSVFLPNKKGAGSEVVDEKKVRGRRK